MNRPMNREESRARWLSLIALACAFALPPRAHAALVVDGPTTGVQGGIISFEIGLDAAFTANIDELTLEVQFDPDVLTGQNAVAGPLLASGSFAANAPAGTATHSFLATLTDLGPGVLATWTFLIDPTAVPQTATTVRARLQTFIIDSELTGDLLSEPLTVVVVPVPATLPLLGSALIALGGLLRRRAS